MGCAPQHGRRGQTRLAADEERARRTLQRGCDIVEVWRACLRLQPQRNHYSRVHVEVAATSVGRAVARSTTPLGFAPSRPATVRLFEASVLHVRERSGFVTSVDTRGEYKPVLQRLVFLPIGPCPTERVGEQPRQHRERGEVAGDADMVNRYAAEGEKRRLKPQYEPAPVRQDRFP